MASQVYPRVGGGNGALVWDQVTLPGLSPRGRGKLNCVRCTDGIQRSIPAWAGETDICKRNRAIGAVYPRVGGGNLKRRYHPRGGVGLSPRGRGKRMALELGVFTIRSIPAWAGETRFRGEGY